METEKFEKFLELQFQTLRKEIEETKGRIFKLEVGGVGIPILPIVFQFFSNVFYKAGNSTTGMSFEYAVAFLTLVAPFFIIGLILAFIAEKMTLMRCGRYIRYHIEPVISSVTGWENWLETAHQRRERDCDQFVAQSFAFLWVSYYAFTSMSACLSLLGSPIALKEFLAVSAFFIYSIVGFLMWWYYHNRMHSLYHNSK
jgi:hypothetical protein